MFEHAGVERLWDAGLHPDELPGLAAPARSVKSALSVAYFLGAAYCTPSPAWTEDVLRYAPDPHIASWLVWLDSPNAGKDAAR